MYDEGPNALRLKRLQSLQKLGLIDKDIVSHDLVNLFKTTLWDEMSPDEKAKSCRSMEVVSSIYHLRIQQLGADMRSCVVRCNGGCDRSAGRPRYQIPRG